MFQNSLEYATEYPTEYLNAISYRLFYSNMLFICNILSSLSLSLSLSSYLYLHFPYPYLYLFIFLILIFTLGYHTLS
jgi:hypothetical protein